ncbi:hypothetical protein G6F32_014959 [Rhizopus arrhizus]|nr:hypothetical protein G6F32_014959 [Rhizopus arrhizus]
MPRIAVAVGGDPLPPVVAGVAAGRARPVLEPAAAAGLVAGTAGSGDDRHRCGCRHDLPAGPGSLCTAAGRDADACSGRAGSGVVGRRTGCAVGVRCAADGPAHLR